MPPVIHIPDPCHEDWNAMQPEGSGRHCTACSRLVVDFTEWEPETIAAYLKAQAGNRVCGRFRSDAVAPQQPERAWLESVFLASVPLLRKIAAAVLFFFGTTALEGCTGAAKPDAVAGQYTLRTESTVVGESVAIADTPGNRPIVGFAAMPDSATHKKSKQAKGCSSVPADPGEMIREVTMGAPVWVEPLKVSKEDSGRRAGDSTSR